MSKPKQTTQDEGVDKRSISAPPEVFKAADDQMQKRGFGTFSEYVRTLIRGDLKRAKTNDA